MKIAPGRSPKTQSQEQAGKGTGDCAQAVTTRCQPREVVFEYLRFLEQGDASALDEVVAEDVVVYKPNGEKAFTERAAWTAAVRNEPFADSKIEVEDLVALRYRLECIQIRPVFGVSPSDRRITTSGTKIYRVRDGKIVGIAGHDDTLGVLRQLGVLEIEM